jgi:GT2 family glycosyltransferase
MENVAFIFTTILRREEARRCILSAREHFPELAIYVADQSGENSEQADFYRRHDVSYWFVSFDMGLSAARNFLIEKVQEKYILIGDDDFIFTEETKIDAAIAVLDKDPEVGFVGGKVVDIGYDNQGNREIVAERHYEYLLNYRPAEQLLIYTPVDWIRPIVRHAGQIEYLLCDIVLNFGIFRRQMFEDERIRWEERIKINGEHEDFFLKVKMYSKFRVAYCDSLKIDHQRHIENEYKGLRYRQEGRSVFTSIWNLRQELVLGDGTESGLRIVNGENMALLPLPWRRTVEELERSNRLLYAGLGEAGARGKIFRLIVKTITRWVENRHA